MTIMYYICIAKIIFVKFLKGGYIMNRLKRLASEETMTVDELRKACIEKLNAMYDDTLSICVFGIGEHALYNIAKDVWKEHCDDNMEKFDRTYLDLFNELLNECP